MAFHKKNVYEEYTEGLDKNDEDFEQEAFDQTTSKSIHNMGSFHFIRFHRLLIIADQMAIEVEAYDNTEEYKKSINYYYSTLKRIYKNIKGYLTPQIREKYEKRFTEMKELRLRFISTRNPPGRINHPEKLIELLDETHSDLNYSIDFHMGLGIPRERAESPKKMARRALGLEE